MSGQAMSTAVIYITILLGIYLQTGKTKKKYSLSSDVVISHWVTI